MTTYEWLLVCGYCVMAGYFLCVIEVAIDAAPDGGIQK